MKKKLYTTLDNKHKQYINKFESEKKKNITREKEIIKLQKN